MKKCWNPNRLQEEDKSPGVFSRLFGLRSPRRPSTPVRKTCQSKSAVGSREHRDGAPALCCSWQIKTRTQLLIRLH